MGKHAREMGTICSTALKKTFFFPQSNDKLRKYIYSYEANRYVEFLAEKKIAIEHIFHEPLNKADFENFILYCADNKGDKQSQ